jgi:hypothetical protein
VRISALRERGWALFGWRTHFVDPTLILCACMVVALGTRLVGSSITYTSDEGYWMQRAIRFGGALARGDFEMTYRIGHPGVTVMWVGLAGIGPQRLASFQAQRFTGYTSLERDPRYGETFAAARLEMIRTTALLIAAVVGLAWILLGREAGLLGGALLLFDPYVVGMTRLLHVDALLAPLMSVSALAGLIWWRDRQRRYLMLSAVAGGLALLTKAPAAYLPIFFATVGIVTGCLWRAPSLWLLSGAAWGLIASAVYVGLWPAMWVDPIGTATDVVRFAMREGGQPHNWSSFFLGEPRTADPGPLFYPVTLAYRLGPIILLGLLVALISMLRRPRDLMIVLGLLGYAIGFIALMTVGGKKFDRYLLPAIVMLDLLAGVGLWMLFRTLRHVRVRRAAIVATIAAQGVLLWSAYPYPIAFYNPALGGVAGAQRVMLVGWGEGLDQVAAYLNGRRGSDRLVASTLYHHALRPLFRGRTQRIVEPVSPDYFVVYINMAQRQLIPRGIQDLIQGRDPELIVRVHGVEYAWVYRLPPGLPTIAPGQPLERFLDGDAPDEDER